MSVIRSRLSISASLPLAVAALMIVVLSVMAAAGYLEVRASAIALAAARLDDAERQISELISAAVPKGVAALKAEANGPDALAVLASRSADASARLAERWNKVRSGASLELWDASLVRVVSAGPPLAAMPPSEAMRLSVDAAKNGFVFGPFTVQDRKAIQTEIAAAYADGAVAGYLVDRRPLNTSQQFMTLVTNLIGSNSRLLLGDSTGTVWTDFTNPVAGPPPATRLTNALMEYERADHQKVFAHQRAVPMTPWVVIAEVPQSLVLAPVNRFVRRAGVLLLLLALGGAGVGWVISGRFTRPLRRMTETASAIARAHSSTEPLVDRDELQRLAFAFDQMVAALRTSDEALRATNARLERRVQERTVELTEANRELEAFSYSVSHDLRAPLRAMSGFAQILIEDHAGELSPPARKCVDTICGNAKSMGQLIDDLLEFSRLSRQPIRRVTTDVSGLARAAFRDARAGEAERCIDVVVPDLPHAQAEPVLVALILDNLVRNAVKFTRPRAEARIEVGAITTDAGAVAYFVRDNGVGFDMRYADKLFGVFQRLHRKDQFEGTGVGLAIVQRVVLRHGGRVWAESEVDHGATFFFTLPAEPGRQDAPDLQHG